jgi:hypothetical protein
MARITVSTEQLAALGGPIRVFVRFVRRLSLVAVAAVGVLVALFQRDGFTADEAVLTILLLAAPAILLFFAQGVQSLLSFPERLSRVPADGGERLAELTQLAGQSRTKRARGLPVFLWRLRGTVGSVRDVAGVALPLRVFMPGFLAVAAFSAVICILLPPVVLVALFVIALGG